MAEATQRVRVKENARDERTGLVVYAGEEKTMLASVAARFVAADVAVAVQDEAMEEFGESVKELNTVAQVLGVELSDEKPTKSEIIEAIKKGT